MKCRAPRIDALRPQPALRWLGRLLLLCLAAFACTKEAPREPPPPAEEQAAPPPQTPEPAPPPSAEPEAPSQQDLRKEESDTYDFGTGTSKAAPAKPATPAAPSKKGRSRSDAARSAAPNAGKDRPSIDMDSPSPESLRRQLGKAVELSTPDCPSARERKQAICDLASQLCQLVDRDPDVASVEAYCADARQRCNEAQRRTAERCPR